MPTILQKYGNEILKEWMAELAQGLKSDRRISESELMHETGEFIALLEAAASRDGTGDLDRGAMDARTGIS